MSDILGGAIVGLILGLVLFFSGFSTLKFKRLIENTPTSKIRSLAMGLVEVYGEALPINKPLKSPLSQTDCVYYFVNIEEYRSQGKHSSWVSVYVTQSKERFYIKDDTGKVVVDPEFAVMDLPADNVSQSSFGKDPSKQITGFLTKNNISYEGLLGANKTMRYTETFIAPKDKLYVMGTATTNTDVSATSKNSDNIIITKGDKKNIFYISDSQEKDILKKLNRTVLWSIYGGGALTLACLVILLLRFGML
jgi:hypothetical protein